MKRILQISTPAAAATFLVVGITGLMMFFHLAQSRLESLHEWAGLAMVCAAGLHAARNWRALLAYGRRGRSLQVSLVVAALGASAVLAAVFIQGPRGGLDALRVRVERSPLVELAPILDEAPEELAARLRQYGFDGVTTDATPAQIAAASRRSDRDVLEALSATENPLPK